MRGPLPQPGLPVEVKCQRLEASESNALPHVEVILGGVEGESGFQLLLEEEHGAISLEGQRLELKGLDLCEVVNESQARLLLSHSN